jgi:hypothetical protein
MIRTRVLAGAALGAVLLLSQAPAPRSSAEDVDQVIVTNFPKVQQVEGSVRVAAPVPQSELVRRLDVIVPPVDRASTTQLADAGIVEAAGFTHAVLSLRGEVQGNLMQPGTAGAILVPLEDPVLRALQEEGHFEFALEVQAPVTREHHGTFASDQPRFALGFPRYRLLLYNTSDRSVEADVYVYLTN